MNKEQLYDDYDDYEINTRSDLFRLIELKLRESRGIPKRLKHAYEECAGWANVLRSKNKELIELPDVTLSAKLNLVNLRDWCTDFRRHNTDKVSKTDKMTLREIKAGSILKEIPATKLAELALKLDVSPATVSRLKVWKSHKSKLLREQFSNKVESPHQIKPRP